MWVKAFITAVTAALNAYCAHLQWKRETYVDSIEDEIDKISATSDNAASKLRIKRLLVRKKRYIEQFSAIRSSTDSLD